MILKDIYVASSIILWKAEGKLAAKYFSFIFTYTLLLNAFYPGYIVYVLWTAPVYWITIPLSEWFVIRITTAIRDTNFKAKKECSSSWSSSIAQWMVHQLTLTCAVHMTSILKLTPVIGQYLYAFAMSYMYAIYAHDQAWTIIGVPLHKRRAILFSNLGYMVCYASPFGIAACVLDQFNALIFQSSLYVMCIVGLCVRKKIIAPTPYRWHTCRCFRWIVVKCFHWVLQYHWKQRAYMV